MKDSNTSSTSCLIVDTIPFGRLFKCKLERKNYINSSTWKKTKKIKLENVYLYVR